MKDRPVWYLPHYPVTHSLEPNKVRVVYDCGGKYGGTSLTQQLLQGPDQKHKLVGVLSRFRQESVGVVADVFRCWWNPKIVTVMFLDFYGGLMET